MSFRSTLIAATALPYKRRLQYLESTGTQYIDTGYLIPESGCTIEFDASFENCAAANLPFFTGNRDVAGSQGYLFMFFNESGGLRQARGYIGSAFAIPGSATISRHTYKTVLSKSSDLYRIGCRIDNGTVVETTNSVSYSSGRSLTFFGNHYSDSVQSTDKNAGVRVYGYRIAGVRDMIPVLDFNDVACMYDQVTGQFFYNQGTGAFRYNPVPLTYLESTGTQYIDTGYLIPESGCTIEFDASFENCAAANAPFFTGNRDVAGSQGYLFMFLNESGGLRQARGYIGSAFAIPGSATISRHTYKTELYKSSDAYHIRCTLDSGTAREASNTVSYSSGRSLTFFGNHYSSAGVQSMDKNAGVRVYGYRIAGVMDLIPAFYGGQVGMYDRVTGQMFYNAGSGNFLYEF